MIDRSRVATSLLYFGDSVSRAKRFSRQRGERSRLPVWNEAILSLLDWMAGSLTVFEQSRV